MKECGDEATAFQPGQRVVCVPSQAWSALDGSGTWQQVSPPPLPDPVHKAFCMPCIYSAAQAFNAAYSEVSAVQMMVAPQANLFPVPNNVSDRDAAQLSV